MILVDTRCAITLGSFSCPRRSHRHCDCAGSSIAFCAPERSNSGMISSARAMASSIACCSACVGRSSTASSTRSLEPGWPTPEAQPPEIGADMRDHIAQAVVAAVAAALLEPRDPGRQIDVVVHHQDLGRRDAIEVRATATTGAPLRFMNAVGLSSHSSGAGNFYTRQLRVLLAHRDASCRASVPPVHPRTTSRHCAACARIRARDCRGRR